MPRTTKPKPETRFIAAQAHHGDADAFMEEVNARLRAIHADGGAVRKIDQFRESGPHGTVQTAYLYYFEGPAPDAEDGTG